MYLFQRTLTEHQSSMKDLFDDALQRRGLGAFAPSNGPARSAIPQAHSSQYCYDGSFWCVPKDFKFASMKLRQGWQCWMRGLPGNRTEIDGQQVSAPIEPFRKMNANSLKPKMSSKLRGEIAPVFRLMEMAPEFVVSDAYTQEELDNYFDKGIEFIQSRVSYIFLDLKWKDYSVGTFCKKLKASNIRKNGTLLDKQRLTSTAMNRERPLRRRRR